MGSSPTISTNDVFVQTIKTDGYKNQSENKSGWFFCCLKQRLEFICEFAKVTPTFINGSIRKLEKTNLTYIEPHKVIIKSITFLVFNYSNDVYISNLSKKIKLSELEEYLKKI